MDNSCWRTAIKTELWNYSSCCTSCWIKCKSERTLDFEKSVFGQSLIFPCLDENTFFGSYQPRIDDKHSRWLHLRIRPSTLPFLDHPAKYGTPLNLKTKPFVDGRWILAFQDEGTCKSALSMVLEEINLQSQEVERRLKPLVDLERAVDSSEMHR